MAEKNLMLDNEGLPEAVSGHHSASSDDGSSSIRFEDLTVDDDLPIIDRVVRYMRSSIALQRLVHVKMLAETSDLAGYVSTY
jgi:serine/threonine-protein phosphatase 4 regulatory subunit 1